MPPRALFHVDDIRPQMEEVVHGGADGSEVMEAPMEDVLQGGSDAVIPYVWVITWQGTRERMRVLPYELRQSALPSRPLLAVEPP